MPETAPYRLAVRISMITASVLPKASPNRTAAARIMILRVATDFGVATASVMIRELLMEDRLFLAQFLARLRKAL